MIRYCTTTNFVGKPVINNTNNTIESPIGIKKISALAYEFYNQEVSFEQMFEWLTEDGYPYSPYLTNDHKHNNNFAENYVAMVDIDHGMTIEDLLDDKFYKEYGSGYYTTASHTDDEPRFRILFRLEKPITDKDNMVLLNKALIRYYGTDVADSACKDACRMFYGSINAEHKEMTKRYLPNNKIKTLIEKQRNFEKKRAGNPQQAIPSKHMTSTNLCTTFKKRVIELAKDMYLGSYPQWIRFGWGLKQGGFDVADFCTITQGMMRQKTDTDAYKVWNSGKMNGGVTLGTCIHMLKMHYGPDCFKGIKQASLPRSDIAPTKIKKHGTINILNAEPGAGKSTALRKRINESNEKYIIVVPSKELMQEYEQELNGATAIIHVPNNPVGQQLNNALYDNARVILITHAGLKECIDVPTFEKLSRYHLFIDEVFQPLDLEMMSLEESIGKDGVLNRICKFIPLPETQDIYRIKIKNRKRYNQYLKTKDTQCTIENEKTREFLKSVDNPKYNVLISKMDRSEKGNYCVVTLFNLRLFKHFKSVTLVSAFVQYTMLYHCFARYFNLVDVTQEYNLTRNLNHRYSSLVLMYLLEGNYSKYARNNTRFCEVGDKDFCIKYYQEHQQHHHWAMTTQEYNKLVLNGCDTFDVDCTLIINNKDDGQSDIGIPLSSMCHGLNKHQDKDSISYVAAFNFPPWANPVLEKFIPSYNSWFERNVLTGVQAIMRTSLRSSDSNAVVKALVSDKRTCIAIKNLLKKLPKIKPHCLFNAYESFTIENEKKERITLTEEEKREKKRISNQKYNAIHNAKRKKN